MGVWLRQIALVAGRLAPAVEDLRAIFSIRPCHIDPAVAEFGLENTLLPIGTNFIEVVAPTQPDTAAGRFLRRRRGDGGYMVITQVPTSAAQAACRTRAAAKGVRVAWEMSRPDWRIMQLHPRDMGGSFFEIDWHDRFEPEGFWGPAGGAGWKGEVDDSLVAEITGAEIQAEDPAATAALWAAVAGGEAHENAVAFENATLRFVPDTDGRGPGLSAVDIRANDPDRIMQNARARGCAIDHSAIAICGTRFNLAA